MHLGLVPSRNKHAKMSPRELGWCWLWNRSRSMCQIVTVFGLSWWNLRRDAKLRGPKTYHRDGNHATSKAKAAETKDKTETECDGDASTRRTGVTCRNGTTNHVNDGHAPPPPVLPVPLLRVLCPALWRTMSSVPFYPTDECSESLKKHDEIKKRGFADGFRESPGATRPQRPPLQFVATTVTRAHHSRILHDDQDQRAARIFRDLETDRRAHDDRVRWDPVVHGREPVPYSGAVHRSTHHPLGTGCRQPQACCEPQRRGTRAQAPLPRPGRPAPRGGRRGTKRCVCWAERTRSCVKEKCSFKIERDGEPVVIRRCVARLSRNCCEEVTGGMSLCTMKASKWHERCLEVLARATSSTHKSTLSSNGLPPTG